MLSKSNNTALLLRFTVLQFFYLFSNGAIFGYASALFLHNGISLDDIGIICAVETACSFLGFIVIGAFCSRIQKIKLPLILFLLFAIGVYTILFLYTKSPFLILLYALLGFVYDPVTALIDSWMLNLYPDAVQSYAKTRTVSLLVYASFFVLFSALISRYSYIVCLIVVFISLGVCIGIALSLPEVEGYGRKTEAGETGTQIPLAQLVRLVFRHMGLFLLMAFCIGICCTSLLTMVPVILEEIHGDPLYQGIGMFLCYVGNSLFSFLSGFFQKIHTLWRCILSAGYMIAGLLSLMLFPSVGVLLVAVFLRGAADGLITVAMRQYVRKNVPASIHTLSHSLCNAFYASLGGALGIAMVTRLYGQFGIAGMSWFCSGIGLVGVGLCFAVFCLLRRKPNCESKESKEYKVSL